MYSTNKSPTLNPMARQNVYVSPRLNPIVLNTYMSDLSDDSITLTDKSSGPIFSSNDSRYLLQCYTTNIKKLLNVINPPIDGTGGYIISKKAAIKLIYECLNNSIIYCSITKNSIMRWFCEERFEGI